MSNVHSPDAQDNLNSAENKLADAIHTLRLKPSQSESNPQVEVIPDDKPDVDVVLDSPTPSQDAPKEPRRSEFVKTDDPKVLERINDLYRQAKQSDARNQMILEHNRQLEQRLAEYTEKFSKIEQTTKDTATSRIESELKQSLRAAREDGDIDRIDEIESQLLDIRLEKRLAERIPAAEQPVIKPQQTAMTPGEQQLVHNAAYIENLAMEKDQSGNLIRPYLYDWHPDNRKVVELFESIPKEFAATGKQVDIKTIMQVLDERVHGKKQKPQASVLSSDGGDISPKNVVRLTADEMDVARKMGIKPEAYARQKQLLMR